MGGEILKQITLRNKKDSTEINTKLDLITTGKHANT